jgi:hypothetical protein
LLLQRAVRVEVAMRRTVTTGTRSRSIYNDFGDHHHDSDRDTDDGHRIKDDDHVYVSDRIQRLIQTLSLPLDDDIHDEIHITTSTGQTIQVLGHNVRSTNQNDNQINTKKNDNIQPSRSWSHETTWRDLFCDSVAYVMRKSNDYPNMYICGVASTAMALIVFWYRRRSSRKCRTLKFPKVTKSSRQSKMIMPPTNAVVDSSKPIDTMTKVVDHVPCTNIEDSNDPNTNDDTNVPCLIREENLDENIHRNNITSKTLLTVEKEQQQERLILQQEQQATPTPPMSIIPTPATSTADDPADQVVTMVSALQEKCQLQNIPYDTSTVWQWAIQQQITHQYIRAQEMIQIRQCQFDDIQQTVHRQLQQQHHQETLQVHREDTNWLPKLIRIRNECHDAILRTIYQCCMGIFITVIVQPIVFVIHLYATSSTMTELFCYNTGTIFDPTHFPKLHSSSSHPSASTSYYEYYFSWYDRYASAFTYIDSYTILAMGDVATCATYTLGRMMFVVVIILVLYMTSWIFHQLTGGTPRIQFICKSVFLLYILSMYKWVPVLYLYRILSALGIILTICYGTITYRYYTVRNKFQSMKQNALPQISDVNEAILWFDDAIHHIQLLPIITVCGLLLILLTST